MTQELHIVGGGMAGSEAAWQAANMGVQVVIHEMRPKVETFAHQTGKLGEMVCSNSFRSDDDEQNAVGLLHWEMLQAGGLIMRTAHANRLPAGGALAVDREAFSEAVTAALQAHPNIRISYEELDHLPDQGRWIFATGPLTSPALGAAIQAGVVHIRVAGTQRFQCVAGTTAGIQNMSGLQAHQSQPGQHPLRDFTIKKLSVIQGSAAIELLLDVGGVDWQRR